MWLQVKRWYEGEKHLYENPPGSPVVIFGWDEKRHWTAQIARVLVNFYLREWKWCWGTALAVVGLILALKRVA